jgi:hypothetical protein
VNVITLGGLSLNPAMVWGDRYAVQSVAMTAKRTLGGKQHLMSQSLVGGRRITLTSGEEFGWLTKTQMEGVNAMASDPSGVYTLVFGTESFQVAFAHFEPPAAAFSALIPRVADEAGDWYIGQIKLVTL